MLEETSFQSMVFIGCGVDFLDTLRLNLTVEETIRWSEPTELKDEYDLVFLTEFFHFFLNKM